MFDLGTSRQCLTCFTFLDVFDFLVATTLGFLVNLKRLADCGTALQDVVEGQAALIKACEKTLSSICSHWQLKRIGPPCSNGNNMCNRDTWCACQIQGVHSCFFKKNTF